MFYENPQEFYKVDGYRLICYDSNKNSLFREFLIKNIKFHKELLRMHSNAPWSKNSFGKLIPKILFANKKHEYENS